jgi:hypothetical protein
MKVFRVPSLYVILNMLIFFSGNSLAQVNSIELQNVFEVFQNVYKVELLAKNESIVFNRKIGNFEWMDLNLLLASYVQIKDEKTGHLFHEITIVGGILKLQGFDSDAAALVLCHEMGHGIGGPPYKSSIDLDSADFLSSTEGQADYFASKECLPRIWNQLPRRHFDVPPQAHSKCRRRFHMNSSDYQFCVRSFTAMKGFILLRKKQAVAPISISFNSHETEIAKELNTDGRYYPSPQCRLDTLMAGALQLPRPRCWYPRPKPV